MRFLEISVCIAHRNFNPVRTKRIYFILGPSPYLAVNTSHLGYKSQSLSAVWGKIYWFFLDKCKTYQYRVARMYNFGMLKLAVSTITAKL